MKSTSSFIKRIGLDLCGWIWCSWKPNGGFSDGIDVLQPVSKSRFLFGIAETYDVVVTESPKALLEIVCSSLQDGSGHNLSKTFGNGALCPAREWTDLIRSR